MKTREIACRVRADFEAGAIDESELKLLYRQYNPLDDIDSFMAHAREMFPRLNCGLATVYLKKIFPDGKIAMGKYGENNHTFLLLDELVIDITSDQYGGPKVYVGGLQSPWSISNIPAT